MNNGELRILMLEDLPSDAALTEHELRKAGLVFTSMRVDSREAFVKALEEFNPDVILSDYQLPDFDGLSALNIVRQTHPEIPVIMVTGALSDIEAVELLQAGAKDYVLKDRLARVGAAVERALSIEQGVRARKAAEKALRESEERFRLIAETINEVFWMADAPIEKMLYVSPAYEHVWRRSRKSLYQDPRSFIAAIHPQDMERVLSDYEFKNAGKPFSHEYRIRLPDGTIRWIWDRGFPITNEAGKVIRYVGAAQDITDRKQAEEELRRTNRALKTLSACNAVLVQTADEQELLQEMCRVITEIGGYSAAWVGYKQHDEEKSVRPMASSGFKAEWIGALRVSWADSECGQGLTGQAVRSGAVQAVRDVASGLNCEPWHAQFERYHVASAIALPLLDGAEAFGVLTIYTTEAATFGQEETALLQEMADGLSFGIRMLRLRQEQQRSTEQIRKGLEGTVQATASMVEMRDPYTAGHQRRVAQLAAAIAIEMGLSEEQARGIHLAGTIHDLGKIRVPAEILSKPGKLSASEFSLIKDHPRNGYEILKDIEFPWPIAQMILQHHERLDGSGYPQGLKGDEILLEARILAVADTVEAMSSHRPYRPGLGIDVALEEISKRRGSLYDPKVVDACLILFREKGYRLDAGLEEDKTEFMY